MSSDNVPEILSRLEGDIGSIMTGYSMGESLWRLPTRGEFYALAAKFSTIAAAGVSLVIATILVPPTLLGYYYSFLSIAMWRVAADGGMSYLIVRFVAHEWGQLDGGHDAEIAEARLASLVRMVVPIYLSIAALFGVGTYILGLFWFDTGTVPSQEWHLPLIALAIVMGLNMVALPARAMVEGINDIAASNRGTMISVIIGACGCWTLLLLHLPFYAVPGWFFLSGVTSLMIWLPALRPLVAICQRASHRAKISWWHEFWPLQWRLLLSTIAGLALYQLFVPISFKVLGPVSAGRIGTVLQLQQAIDQIGSVWVQARTPSMAILAAKLQFARLRELAWRTNVYSVLSALLAAAGVFVVYLLVWLYFPNFSSKLVSPITALFFFSASVLLQAAHVETAVVRCQKKEPFVPVNLGCGILMIAFTVTGAKLWGEIGIGLAFLICNGGALVLLTLWISNRATPDRDMEKVLGEHGESS